MEKGNSMNKKIYDTLKDYEISELEIKDILNLSPMMDVITYEEFIENCYVLVRNGYPQSDLDVLIMSNPKLFVGSPKDLEEDLIKLKKEYGDIEEILKDNPNII